MCWVMPPASPAATSVSRIASSSEVLPWSTWPMIVITGGRSISSSSVSSKAGSSSASSVAPIMSTFLSKDSASTSIASSDSVWVSVAISPSSISFLITSGAPSWSDSATSLTVEPERTWTAGSSRLLGLEPRLRLGLEIGLDPLRAGACGRARGGAAGTAGAAGSGRAGRPASRSPRGAGGRRRRRRPPRRDHRGPGVGRRRRRRGVRRRDRAPPPRAAAAVGPGAGRRAPSAVRGRPAASGLALLRGRGVLEDARAAPLGTGAPHGLALGGLDVGTRLGRAAGATGLPVAVALALCGGGRLGLSRGRLGLRGRRAVGGSFLAAFFVGAFFADAFLGAAWQGRSRRRRCRTLAASSSSTLEAATLTSRPALRRTSSASLLVIPRSLAISWTRFFAIGEPIYGLLFDCSPAPERPAQAVDSQRGYRRTRTGAHVGAPPLCLARQDPRDLAVLSAHHRSSPLLGSERRQPTQRRSGSTILFLQPASATVSGPAPPRPARPRRLFLGSLLVGQRAGPRPRPRLEGVGVLDELLLRRLLVGGGSSSGAGSSAAAASSARPPGPGLAVLSSPSSGGTT